MLDDLPQDLDPATFGVLPTQPPVVGSNRRSSHHRIHKTLRVTPAMEAGISSHVWSLDEIAALSN